MKQGIYRLKLRKTFIAIAFCFVVFFGIFMTCITVFSQRSSYELATQHTVSAKSDSTRVTLSTIISALNRLKRSENAKAWAESKSKAEYYYYSSALYKEIGAAITNISLVNYDISITQNNSESFVITYNGTVAKDRSFNDNSDITSTAWNSISDYFINNKSPYILPIYKNNSLDSIYYISESDFEESSLLFIVKIPAVTLCGNDAGVKYAICNDSSVLAYSSIDEKDKRSLNKSIEYIKAQKDPSLLPYEKYYHSGKDLFVIHTIGLPWTIIYEYKFSAISAPVVFAVIILPVILFAAILIFVFTKLSERLYRPINEVIANALSNDLANVGEDEFQIIRQNVNEVTTLSEQLKTTTVENDAMFKRRYYRELLYGIPDLNCPLTAQQMSAGYCVAVIEIQYVSHKTDANDWFVHLQKNFLYTYVQDLRQNNCIQCISVGYNTCAIIIQTHIRQEAEEILNSFYDIPDLTAALKIALSNVQENVIHICDCFEQAQRILEYRYTFADAKILTTDHVNSLSSDSYYFPLMLENKLIQLIACGSSASIELYDKVISDNFSEKKSPEVLRNLICALIGTLMRVFQELKTTPLILISKDIDFQWLYLNWNNPNINNILREQIKSIVIAIQYRNESAADAILKQMLDFIYNNFQEDIMLADIASHCEISPTYCSTLFKRLSNDNFKTFLNRYRIEQACKMLEENPDIKINDLSQTVGFNSSNSFIRAFGKVAKITPKAYAEQCANNKLFL